MSSPARVVYHIPLLSPGGAERNLVDLALRLDRRRFLPLVWCSEADGPLAAELERAGVPVVRQSLDIEGPQAARHCVEMLRSLDPVLFHSMTYRRSCSDVLAAVFAGVPLIVTNRQNTRHWDPDQTVCDWELIRNRMTDAVVANAARLAAECIRVEQLPAGKVHVVRNGIVVPEMRGRSGWLRRELGLPDHALVAGNVGNLKPQKAQDDLLRAWARVLAAVPECRLLLCGADYGLGPKLQDLARELGIVESVLFLGSRSDMPDLYPELDLLVQSSKAEGISTAVLEAMAFGVPVVATDAGGSAEAIADGRTGRIVPVGRPDLLADAAVQLLRDPHTRAEYGAAGRERVCREFGVERVVSEHEALYARLLTTLRSREAHAVSGV